MKSIVLAAIATLGFATAALAENIGMATRDLACTHGTITQHGTWDCR